MVATMNSLRSPSRTRAPALRLLQGQRSAHPDEPLRRRDAPPPALQVIDGPARVLLAGSDAGRRAALLDELAQTLSAGTVFAEADAVCDVLEHAPNSRMAFITGDLDDTPAESLMHVLAHRHPELPVLIVDSPVRNTDGPIAAHQDELRIRHA
jgi:hypothetical protein